MWNVTVQIQMEGLRRCGSSGTALVGQNNTILGGDASLSVQKHTWFILDAINMPLLNLPDVLILSWYKRGKPRMSLPFTLISSLRRCSIMMMVCCSPLVFSVSFYSARPVPPW